MKTLHIGILGGGQLGRMLALAGYPLGIRVRTLDPAPAAPAGAVSELLVGDYTDEATLARFAQGLAVITYEFENVPVTTARFLQRFCPVYPPPLALAKAQDRLVEKSFLRELGIPTPSFWPVEQRADLDQAITQIGLPAVLKTRRMGYDGKGQAVLRTAADIDPAWAALQAGGPLILESFVAFDREVSQVAVRSVNGDLRFYPLVANEHVNGILAFTHAPAPGITPALQTQAEGYARRLLEALDYVGVLAIELFQVGDQLIANEIAPRVHNSGHWSIEGAVTSQFANHMRAILGLPLGECTALGPSAMINLIGNAPDPAAVLHVPGAYFHLYDKAPRPGRKIGHITVCAVDEATLNARVAAVKGNIGMTYPPVPLPF